MILFAIAAATAFPTFHKEVLQDLPFPTPVYHTVVVRTVIDHGGTVPPHVHPGIETGYVLKGHAKLKLADGSERQLGPGDSFFIPEKVTHSVSNVGRGKFVVMSTYVVEAAQPIATIQP